MIKVGLTGGIGSGKSTVAKVFQILGAPVFNADAATKEIMNQNLELREMIEKEFGKNVYINDKVDRKYLASIVFNDAFKLSKLNTIVHPFAIQAGVDWANEQASPYIIKEAALMFESGSAAHLNYVIGVFAPKEIRIERILKRDTISKNDIDKRMKNQIDENIKMKLCDYIIINNEKKLLIPQILELNNFFILQHNKIKKVAKKMDC
ncbi:MAG: dephospho-CoA kinase [Chitinophagaceae bacterium]